MIQWLHGITNSPIITFISLIAYWLGLESPPFTDELHELEHFAHVSLHLALWLLVNSLVLVLSDKLGSVCAYLSFFLPLH